jgi:hypothetical protein
LETAKNPIITKRRAAKKTGKNQLPPKLLLFFLNFATMRLYENEESCQNSLVGHDFPGYYQHACLFGSSLILTALQGFFKP